MASNDALTIRNKQRVLNILPTFSWKRLQKLHISLSESVRIIRDIEVTGIEPVFHSMITGLR